MLTWRLWRALCNPPYSHPLFQRTLTMQVIHSRARRFILLAVGYMAICTLATFIWPMLFSNSSIMVLILAALSNTIYSIAWAAGVSSAIAKEQELETYDLLCLQPTGAFGVGWALCTGNLHRNSFFKALRFLMPVISISAIVSLVIALGISLFLALSQPGFGQTETTQLLVTIIYAIVLAVAFLYIDYVQSAVMANLIGMITPTYVPNRLYARLWAVSGFLLLQMTVYLLTIIVGFIILPVLFTTLTPDNVHISILLSVIRLLWFYVLREITIFALWNLLVRRFNASAGELKVMLRAAK
jgi:hypothetical protein